MIKYVILLESNDPLQHVLNDMTVHKIYMYSSSLTPHLSMSPVFDQLRVLSVISNT